MKIELGKNCSVRLLYRMLKYYTFVSSGKLPTLSAKLSLSHDDEFLRFDDINKITEEQNLSIRQLRLIIKSNEYKRLPKGTRVNLVTKKRIQNISSFQLAK